MQDSSNTEKLYSKPLTIKQNEGLIYYTRNKIEINLRYKNEYIAIRESEIVEHSSDFSKLSSILYKKNYNDDEIYITKTGLIEIIHIF